MGIDVDGYVKIPRGLLEELLGKCKNAGIVYDIEDQREKGRPIRVKTYIFSYIGCIMVKIHKYKPCLESNSLRNCERLLR